jgi:hypothetical protein
MRQVLLRGKFEGDAAQWCYEVIIAIQQKRHLVSVFGIDRKVESLFLIESGSTQW